MSESTEALQLALRILKAEYNGQIPDPMDVAKLILFAGPIPPGQTLSSHATNVVVRMLRLGEF